MLMFSCSGAALIEKRNRGEEIFCGKENLGGVFLRISWNTNGRP